jgi:hypothetical protein
MMHPDDSTPATFSPSATAQLLHAMEMLNECGATVEEGLPAFEQLGDAMAKACKLWERRYRAAGSPYGNDHRGFALWMKERDGTLSVHERLEQWWRMRRSTARIAPTPITRATPTSNDGRTSQRKKAS